MQAVPYYAQSGRVVVRVVEDCTYSTDNGITLTAFERGEFYPVPEHVANGMIKRNWAVHAKEDEIPRADDKQEPVDLPPLKSKAKGAKS